MGFGGFIPPGARLANSGNGSWWALGEPNTVGSTSQQIGQFWGSSTTISDPVTSTIPVCAILMESPRTALQINAAPLLPRMKVKILDGQIDLGPLQNLAGSLVVGNVYTIQLGVGIYLARLNAGATILYDIQDPLSAVDCSRFDWIYHESRTVNFLASSVQAAQPIGVPLTPKLFDLFNMTIDVDITPGSALMLAVNAVSSSAGFLAPLGTNASFIPQLKAFLSAVGA